MRIKPANTHPVWDPAWAEPQIAEGFRAQLALGTELTRYGSDLLLRALQSAPDDVPHHVILSVLFRQAIAALDAAMVSLRVGAVAAATIHARGQMEAGWGLLLALREPVKWGRHVYVTSLRQQRYLLARLIPGMPEYLGFEEGRKVVGAAATLDAEAETEVREFVRAIDAVLAKPENAAINAGYERERASSRRDHEWYYDAAAPKGKRISSISRLAREVGAFGEYQTLYKHSSNYVHGGFTGAHLKFDERGAALAAIRTPEEWRQTFVLVVSLAANTFRKVIDRFRPDELDQYVRKYVEQWRATIDSTPEVEVVLERFANL